MKSKAFSLVELVIVVSILGILAAITIPQLQGNTTEAREAVAKDMLYTLRAQIELYRVDHGGIRPGYWGTGPAPISNLMYQFAGTSKASGIATASQIPAGDYIYGPYFSDMPKNPFNGKATLKYVPNGTAFSAAADDSTGWLYTKETGKIALNTRGQDVSGKKYADY